MKCTVPIPYEGIADNSDAILTDRYLSELELATRWSVSVKTLQKWRYSGEGPPYQKFVSAVRYSLARLVAYEQAAIQHNQTNV